MAAKKHPPPPPILNSLAWALAVSTDPQIRNPARSLELSIASLSTSRFLYYAPESQLQDTLACAYFANLEPIKAIEIAKNFQLQKRIKSFSAGLPCVDKSYDYGVQATRDLASPKKR